MAVTEANGAVSDIIVVVPVFNDWAAVTHLLRHLDLECAQTLPVPLRVLLVDDGSTQPIPDALSFVRMTSISEVRVVALRRNLGHQRAIAVGLCYVEANMPCRAVVVMDGDGEDKPSDVPRLLEVFESHDGNKAVFAERARRTESLMFRAFYIFYKAIHLVLTGQRVRVGNFSVLPCGLLTRLVVVSDIWNHYAAAVFKARLPVERLPLARGYRYDGTSHMNFVSLIVHGLSAMSVYGDRIGVRLLISTSIAIAVLVTVLIGAAVLRFGFGVIMPNTVALILAAMALVLPQFLMIALIFVFLILAGRDSSSFVPLRDHALYIYQVNEVYNRGNSKDAEMAAEIKVLSDRAGRY